MDIEVRTRYGIAVLGSVFLLALFFVTGNQFVLPINPIVFSPGSVQAAQVSCAVNDLTCGLIGWWKLDDGSGLIASDHSGNARNATLNGDVTWATGNIGSAVSFSSGTSSHAPYVALPSSLPANQGDFTISAWVNIPSFTHPNMAVWGINGSNRLMLRSTSEYLSVNGVTISSCTTPSNAGSWILFTIVRSGSTAQFYRNGSPMCTWTPGTGGLPLSSSLIGSDTIFSNGNSMVGLVDDVRIYDHALTASEIQALYLAQNPGATFSSSPTSPAGASASTSTGTVSHASTSVSDGQRVTAATCSQADVQSAVDLAATGNTVIVPSGTCTWNAPVTVTKGIVVSGSGSESTVITLNNTKAFVFDVSNSTYRLTGFGINGSIGTSGYNAIALNGVNTNIRVDHLAFTNIAAAAGITPRAIMVGYGNLTATRAGTQPYGVIDHIRYTSSQFSQAISIYGDNESWQRANDFGSGRSLYIEDSTFSWNGFFQSGNTVTDGEHGARFVVRHNSITNGTVLWHDTGSTPLARSTRTYEIYNNTFTCNTGVAYGSYFDCGWDAITLRGGSGMIFGNTIPIYHQNSSTGFENASMSEIYRLNYVGGNPWKNMCSGSSGYVWSNFMPYSPSTGNICHSGSQYPDCTGSCTIGSTGPAGAMCVRLDGSASNGYPCRDQTGTGIDDPVTHVQTSSPTYWWNNIEPLGNQLSIGIAQIDLPYIQANRDYFSYSNTFDGTSGVGMGNIAGRPLTCSIGVGYWSTDENTLYQCSSQNRWYAYYRPYTYPYPLDAIGLSAEINTSPISTAPPLEISPTPVTTNTVTTSHDNLIPNASHNATSAPVFIAVSVPVIHLSTSTSSSNSISRISKSSTNLPKPQSPVPDTNSDVSNAGQQAPDQSAQNVSDSIDTSIRRLSFLDWLISLLNDLWNFVSGIISGIIALF